ncbi:phosphodiesterase [Devosia sp. 2618]|uniref:phosphodiesterase n=1 Tax=Devosia sp. 2618 TaxID=3156454 RepID=UPI003398CD2D
MLIAHISDFHVFASAPETSLVRADAEAAARKVVADLVAFTPKIEAVCFTGDLTDGGSDADYALLKDILSPITVPVFVIPGNHDKRDTLRAAFSDLPFTSASTLHYEAEVGGVRILALDTLIDGKVAGQLDAEQLAWLRRKLETVTDGLTLILMHHPAFPSGIKGLDDMSLIIGADELGEIVRNYSGNLRILSGHIHRPYQAIWNGVFAAVGGSPAFQIDLDLDQTHAEPGIVSEPYAYYIHRLNESGGLSVHARYVSI